MPLANARELQETPTRHFRQNRAQKRNKKKYSLTAGAAAPITPLNTFSHPQNRSVLSTEYKNRPKQQVQSRTKHTCKLSSFLLTIWPYNMRIIIGSSLCVIAMDEASTTTTREQERNSKRRRRMSKVVSWGWRCRGISLSRVGIDCSMEMRNREI